MADQFILDLIGKLNKELTKANIEKEFNNISKELSNSNKINLTASLNTTETKKRIETQLSSVTKNLSSNVANNSKISDVIFSTSDLQKQGRKYFDKSKDVLDKVKNHYLKQGALKVDISSIENSKGTLKSFTALVEQSTGEIRKFNYETSMVDTGSGARNRWVQTDSVSAVDKNAGTNLKSTINLLNQIERQIANVNSKTLNMKNPLQEGTSQFDIYKKAYDEIIAKVETLKTANKSMTSAQKSELQTLANAFKNLAREQQVSATGATKLDASSVTASVEKSTASLNVLEEKWKQQGILVGDFKTKVEQLKLQLSTIGDAKGLSNYSTQLSVINSEAQKLRLDNVNANNTEKINSQLQVLSTRLSTAKTKFTDFQGSMKASAVSQYRTEISQVNSAFEKVKSAMANGDVAGAKRYFQEATASAQNFRTEMISAGNVGVSMFERLIKNVKQFSNYLVSATTVMLPLKMIGEIVNNVKELDKALVNLQMATGGTYTETAKLVKSYSELGQELGATTTEVADSAGDFLRQGKSIAETNSLIKSSMVLSKIGMIDSANSTMYITSAMKGYKIATEDVLGIVDKLSAVDMASATSAGGLAEGMSRVANMANLSGVSLDKLLGYLAIVGETTQKELSEVGNSFKLRTVAA